MHCHAKMEFFRVLAHCDVSQKQNDQDFCFRLCTTAAAENFIALVA